MKKLLFALMLWPACQCFAGDVAFKEIPMRSCFFVLPGMQAANHLISSQAEYDEFIFKNLHESLTEFLVNWARNENRKVPEVPEDYRIKLSALRAGKPGLQEAEYIKMINSDLAEPLLVKKVSPVSHLANCSYPVIDFSNERLIIMSKLTGGCGPPVVNHQIVTNNEKRQIQATITVQQMGSCKAGHWINSWLTMPKPSENYEVIFEMREGPVIEVK